jgi:hypothetical protein
VRTDTSLFLNYIKRNYDWGTALDWYANIHSFLWFGWDLYFLEMGKLRISKFETNKSIK